MNGLPVAGSQPERCPQHHRVRAVGQQTVAVRKIHLPAGERPDALLREQNGDVFDDLLHLPIVSAGVHAHRAAHRAGDAVGKFQARQALFAGKVRQPGQRYPRFRCQDFRLIPFLQTVQTRGGIDDQTVQTRVRRQKIRPVADDKGPRPARPGVVQQQHHLLAAGGERHPLRGAAHPKRGVAAHRLVMRDL